MNWYYVDAGQQAGPVEDGRLAELVRSGTIQPDTLVWHEGMTNWLPYRDAAPVTPDAETGAPAPSPALTSGGSGGVTCSECGRVFAPNDVIRYEDKFICAACKPIFFQRLREGAALAGPSAGGTATEADLLSKDYEVDIGGCLTRAWQVFKADPGGLIGVSVVVYLVLLAAGMVAYVIMAAARVPFLNFLTVLINAPLLGGLWLFFTRKVRSQEAALGDAFSTFGPRYWQLVLTQLIPLLVTMGVMALLGFTGALTIPALGGRPRGGGLSTMAPALLIPLVIMVVIGVIAMVYLTTSWLFALPLVADKGLKFWPALELSRRVVNKHWWMTFWLVVVSGVITMAGLFACCLGVLVTGPVAFAMLAVHYDRVFGDLLTRSG